MARFNESEYSGYVRLMRDLKLEREWQEGDWFTNDYLAYGHTPAHSTISVFIEECYTFAYPVPSSIWLPTLADWLEMLWGLSEGYSAVSFCCRGESFPDRGREFEVWTDEGGSIKASTAEEAAARLWMAVKP